MKVFVEVPHAGNLLLGERNYCDSESRLPPLNVALVEVLASLPFKRIFEANPDASLKEPVCCFSNFIKELQSQICKIAFSYPIRIFIRLSLYYNPLWPWLSSLKCSTRATRKGGKSGWNDSITRASDVFRN